jgi:hypothetical protein
MSTSSKVTALLRTADRTRKVEVDLEPDQHVGSLIDAAITNWKLPAEAQYCIANVTQNRALSPTALVGDSVSTRDLLEIQPVLAAG